MKRIAALVLLLLASAAVAALLVAKASVDGAAARSDAALAEQAERLLPRYLALGQAVDADPFFAAARPGGDAGPWLNPRVPWSGAPAGATPELVLPGDLAERVGQWGDQWTAHADEPALDRLDFGWMARLDGHGHWNLIPGGPLEHLAHPSALSMPLPDPRALLTWAKLRLLVSKRRGDGALASREVRHLAWLCHSTEVLVLSIVAQALLRFDRRAQLALQGPWTPYDEAWLERAKAVLWAAPGYASRLLRDDLFSRARSVRAGRCAALGEAATFLLLRRKAGIPLPPGLEREFAAPAPCRLEVARALLERGESLLEYSEALGTSTQERLVTRLFPKTAERYVETTGAPDWFRYLEAAAAGE